MKIKCKGEILLLITAFVWGFAFVAQSKGMEYIGPFSFNVFRFFLGALTLFVYLVVRFLVNKKKNRKPLFTKYSLIGGICCGFFLFVAASLQQYGIQYTSAGKAGFITALYILFVPILSLFLKKKVPWNTWISIVIGLVGLYFLCIKKGSSISSGDIYVFICSFIFAFHILCVDYFAQKADSIQMSCVQFGTAAFLSLILMIWKENITFENIIDAKWSILYAGVLSCALAYTLQILGQRSTNPSVASLLMSLESVFAVIGGMIILDEVLKFREWIGCILIFIAVVFSQLKIKKRIKI